MKKSTPKRTKKDLEDTYKPESEGDSSDEEAGMLKRARRAKVKPNYKETPIPEDWLETEETKQSTKGKGKSISYAEKKEPVIKKTHPSCKYLPQKDLEKSKMHRVILWFRNDIRIHDNPILNWALKQPAVQYKEILPVYCFDPRFFDRRVKEFDIRKTGIVRTKFQLESVAEFRSKLKALGSELFVAHEQPEDFLKKLLGAKGFHTTIVYQQEITDEERKVEKAVQEIAGSPDVDFVSIWGSTLHHIDDLPYEPTTYFPHVYGNFRKKNVDVKVRPLFDTPEKGTLYPMPAENQSDIEKQAASFLPDIEKDFKFTKEEVDFVKDKEKRACYNFVGGEDAGLKRCKEYIFSKRSVAHYNNTRNDLIGANYSSKLSPWLANGSLSPRMIYHEVKRFETEQKRNESTQVFIDELFWRDFNRYWCMANGNKIFSSYGIYSREYYDWKTNMETVNRWRKGMTGVPLIDALMREMNLTGFMPNRGRMVVACYLAMDLKQDWRQGAHWFEEQLIDHDVQSNYGGWSFSAGIGPGRVLVFNSLTQSQKFDPEGKYIKMWCPELENVPLDYIHDPWNMPASLQKASGVQVVDYSDKMEMPSKNQTKVSVAQYPKPIECEKYTSYMAAKKIKRKTPLSKPRTLDTFVSKK